MHIKLPVVPQVRLCEYSWLCLMLQQDDLLFSRLWGDQIRTEF